MSSWPKVTTDQAQTPDPEKRQRPGWIPRLLDINPYKSIQKSSYSPTDGYPKDHEDGNSFEELFGQQYHPTENEVNYERHQYPQKDDSHTKDAHRDKLYMQFYQQIEKEYNRERPSDCVIVSISKDQAEYSTVIGHRLQDHGLVVEMIYLTSESGLTRALQEVKNDGSPFCVLVEPSNVTLSSCTVIMLHQTIKKTNTLATPGEDGEYPNARPSGSALPPTLSKPPPLLPTPGRTSVLGQSAAPSPKPALLGKRPSGALLPTPALVAGPTGKPPPLLTKVIKRPMHLAPPNAPAKRPLLGGRPGLLPTPTYSCSSKTHPASMGP
ncbi:translation initiation factor IF-2-like isoform X5 [Notechis scutatus]|uniref:Translation initiation factor IF-2-like isoform X5 n=1 Tax=Notechis scutatus TaxID=8663 RepID=A0A6J1UVM2_9SAUR|nr:translation initiation factor IF-2-like isoform X5 [Notechis scutatus]